MLDVVVFELRGTVAHFRRPDTLGTHATYPFIPRTSLRGMLASILGLQELPTEGRAGVRLLRPVRTVAQELSMHGKTWEAASGPPSSFHRPTSIELVIEPHYRLFYTGPLLDELDARLRERRSHYHTYLGSAFCLTFPQWTRRNDGCEPLLPTPGTPIRCATVVPSSAVARLDPEEGQEYVRVGGLMWEHDGPFHERRFRGTAVSVIYEANGGPLRFAPATSAQAPFWSFVELPEEGMVCLW